MLRERKPHRIPTEANVSPGVQDNPRPSPYTDMIRMMQSSGAPYPQIWHLFAFKPEITTHLARFTQEIMREPSPLTPGLPNSLRPILRLAMIVPFD